MDIKTVQVIAGIVAGSMVSGMYLTSSRSVGWWLMLVVFASLVGWIRWHS